MNPGDYIEGFLTVNENDIPVNITVDENVNEEDAADLIISPETLDLGTAKKEEVKSGVISVSNRLRTAQDINIKELVGEGFSVSSTTCSSSLARRMQCFINIEYTAPSEILLSEIKNDILNVSGNKNNVIVNLEAEEIDDESCSVEDESLTLTGYTLEGDQRVIDLTELTSVIARVRNNARNTKDLCINKNGLDELKVSMNGCDSSIRRRQLCYINFEKIQALDINHEVFINGHSYFIKTGLDTPPCEELDAENNGYNLSIYEEIIGLKDASGEDVSQCSITCPEGFSLDSELKACVKQCDEESSVANGVNPLNVLSYEGIVVGSDTSQCLINTCGEGAYISNDKKICQEAEPCTEEDLNSLGYNTSLYELISGNKIEEDLSQCSMSCPSNYTLDEETKTCIKSCEESDAEDNGVILANHDALKGTIIGSDKSQCLISSCQSGYSLSLDEKSCSLINRACNESDAIENGVNLDNFSSLKGNVLGTDKSQCLISSCQSDYDVSPDEKSCSIKSQNVTLNKNGDGTINSGSALSMLSSDTTKSEEFNRNILISLTAVDGQNYSFLNWTGDVCNNSTNKICAFNVPSLDVNLTANYEPKQCQTSLDVQNDNPALTNVDGVTNIEGNYIDGCIYSCDEGYIENTTDNSIACDLDVRSCELEDAQSNGWNISNALSASGEVSGENISQCQVSSCSNGYQVDQPNKRCSKEVSVTVNRNVGNNIVYSNPTSLRLYAGDTTKTETLLQGNSVYLSASESNSSDYKFINWTGDVCNNSTNRNCSFNIGLNNIQVDANYQVKTCSNLTDIRYANWNGSNYSTDGIITSSISGDYVNGCSFQCEDNFEFNGTICYRTRTTVSVGKALSPSLASISEPSITSSQSELNSPSGDAGIKTATFNLGVSITLTANDSQNYEFKNWTNGCSDEYNRVCSFTTNEDVFAQAAYQVKECNDVSDITATSSITNTSGISSDSISGDYINGCTYQCSSGYNENTSDPTIACDAKKQYMYGFRKTFNFSRGSTYMYEQWLFKYDLDKTYQWQMRFNEIDSNVNLAMSDIAIDNTNGFLYSIHGQKEGASESGNNTIKKINTSNGSVVWTSPAIYGIPSEITVDGSGDIYLSSGRTVQKVSKTDGSLVWTKTYDYSSPSSIKSMESIDSNYVYIAQDANDNIGVVHKINTSNGNIVWSIGGERLSFSPENSLYVYSPVGGEVKNVNLSNGATISSVISPNSGTQFKAGSNGSFFVENSGNIYYIDSSGNLLRTFLDDSGNRNTTFDIDLLGFLYLIQNLGIMYGNIILEVLYMGQLKLDSN